MPIDIPSGLQALTTAPGADLTPPDTVSARMADPTGAQEWTSVAPPQGSIPMNTVVSFDVEDFGAGSLFASSSGTNPTFSLFWGSR